MSEETAGVQAVEERGFREGSSYQAPSLAEQIKTLQGFHLRDLDIDAARDVLLAGANLTEDQRREASPEDLWYVAFVRGIEPSEEDKIGRAFQYLDFDDYMALQKSVWQKRAVELFTFVHGRPPKALELIEADEQNNNYPAFKLCYVLSRPYSISFVANCNQFDADLAFDFLLDAQQLHPRRLPYLEIISANTLAMSKIKPSMAEVAA